MAVSVSIAGISYTIPENADEDWGTEVTSWIQAASTSLIQVSGGIYTLTADLDFGANFGLESIYYKSRAASVSTSGVVRVGNAEAIGWRNSGDSGDLLLTPGASDGLLNYDGDEIVMRTVTQTLLNKTLTSPTFTSPNISSGGLTITGDIDVNAAGNFAIGASVGANNLTLAGASSTVVIPGNLNVQGTTTTVNSTTLDVTDPNITINDGGNDGTAEGAGLTVERTGTDGKLIYEDSLVSKWKAGAIGSEVELANVSGAQLFTNKDYDGGIASNTSRITVGKNTTGNLNSLTRKEGTIVYDTSTGEFKGDNGASLNTFSSVLVADQDNTGTVTSFVPTIKNSVNILGDAGYTLLDSDGYSVILAGSSAALTASRTITLPTVADNAGRQIVIKKMDISSFSVIIDGEGAETVDGSSTISLSNQYESITIVSDGSEWAIVDKSIFATATQPGIVSNSAQSFSGLKTFTDGLEATGTSDIIGSPSGAICTEISRATVFNNGVGNDVFTMPNNSAYLVVFAPRDNSTSAHGVWFITTNAVGGDQIIVLSATNATASISSGTNIQLTQSSGSNLNMHYCVLKLV
jgi:hypothetical protein